MHFLLATLKSGWNHVAAAPNLINILGGRAAQLWPQGTTRGAFQEWWFLVMGELATRNNDKWITLWGNVSIHGVFFVILELWWRLLRTLKRSVGEIWWSLGLGLSKILGPLWHDFSYFSKVLGEMLLSWGCFWLFLGSYGTSWRHICAVLPPRM